MSDYKEIYAGEGNKSFYPITKVYVNFFYSFARWVQYYWYGWRLSLGNSSFDKDLKKLISEIYLYLGFHLGYRWSKSGPGFDNDF